MRATQTQRKTRPTTLVVNRWKRHYADAKQRWGIDALGTAIECTDHTGAIVGYIVDFYAYRGCGWVAWYEFRGEATHRIGRDLNVCSCTRKHWQIQEAKREFTRAAKAA